MDGSVLLGDCVEVMATFDAESFDAIVTDPPYGLEFMGKEWDRLDGAGFHAPKDEGRTFTNESGHMYDNLKSLPRFGNPAKMQAWHEAWAREAYRVAKPGAHLLAFGGTRTYHRLTCALEDAGWEIRDCLVWAYASGFPKSLDVSKAIDKAAGAEREVVGVSPHSADRRKPSWQASDGESGMAAGNEGERIVTAPATDAAKRWSGWGTALKPAWEPIVLARKPLVGTVAANVTRYGTGALNIDATRIGTTDNLNGGAYAQNGTHRDDGWGMQRGEAGEYQQPAGRWPPNLLLTDAELFDVRNDGVVGSGADDDGIGYSRMFLVPKASRSDREPVWGEELDEGMVGGRSRADGRQWDIPGSTLDNNKPRRKNTHPTTKPVDLMRHLVRLVTPPGGRILDPFLGSGTTAIAAIMEGFTCVGIEREPEYVAIAEARLNGVQAGMGL